jgi:riboflavin synthase
VFSGIIETTGRVRAIERDQSGGAVLAVAGGFDPATLVLGESIATSGVCLTVRDLDDSGFIADLSAETLSRTTLGMLAPGDVVNLERSLRVGDRVSGHFVFGHVDAVGRVRDVRTEGEYRRFAFAAPAELAGFLVDKGSIAVDGISLTMCDCAPATFEVAVIPHTLAATTLRFRRPGDAVNLEVDMLARYVRGAVAAGLLGSR